MRLKTIELVVEETPWRPEGRRVGRPEGRRAGRPEGRRAGRKEDIVSLHVEWQECTLRAAVKGAGGRWNPGTRLWELPYDRVVDLGPEGRIV